MLRSRYPSRFRPLSEGETAMASLLFGDAKDSLTQVLGSVKAL